MTRPTDDIPTPTIQDLYPELSPAEQAEAEHSLKRYLEDMLRIYQELEADGRLQAVLAEARRRNQ